MKVYSVDWQSDVSILKYIEKLIKYTRIARRRHVISLHTFSHNVWNRSDSLQHMEQNGTIVMNVDETSVLRKSKYLRGKD